jgi:hypothetical protein
MIEEKYVKLGEMMNLEGSRTIRYRFNTETKKIETSNSKDGYSEWKEGFRGKKFTTLEKAQTAFGEDMAKQDYNRWLIDTICSM